MVPKRFLSTTMTTTTANSGKNNDYVNMLSNEVCQKLNSATSANSSVMQQSNIIETTTGQTSSRPFGDATDSVKISSAFRDPSTATANIRKMPGSDLLKPIGDCRRCSKTLIANDRVTILGRNFHRYSFIHSFCYIRHCNCFFPIFHHRNCLTCKICNVSLRHDELMASIDDFICKICSKIRSRQIVDDGSFNSNIMTTSSSGVGSIFGSSVIDSKSVSQTPLSSSLNLSLMEAKKNFLENAQQIDLRERAEFELVINDINDDDVVTDSNVNEPADDDDDDDDYFDGEDNDDVDDEFCVENDDDNDDDNQVDETDELNLIQNDDNNEQQQQRQQSSDLSESSDIHCSSDNYTDDEQSSDSSSPKRQSSSSMKTVPLPKSSSSSPSSSSSSSSSSSNDNSSQTTASHKDIIVDNNNVDDFGSGFTVIFITIILLLIVWLIDYYGFIFYLDFLFPIIFGFY